MLTFGSAASSPVYRLLLIESAKERLNGKNNHLLMSILIHFKETIETRLTETDTQQADRISITITIAMTGE